MVLIRTRSTTRPPPNALARRGAILGLGLFLLSDFAVACTPYVEERVGATTAAFRRHTEDFQACPVAESSYDDVMAGWLRNRPQTAPALTGVSLGRAVDFPWISQHLAESALRDPLWDARRGKVRRGGINLFVGSLLSEKAFLARLAVPFADTPYVPVRVSVEKVLVGTADDVLPEMKAGKLRVPFDAQIWLSLEAAP
jgi:hypothetical protein